MILESDQLGRHERCPTILVTLNVLTYRKPSPSHDAIGLRPGMALDQGVFGPYHPNLPLPSSQGLDGRRAKDTGRLLFLVSFT